MQHYNPYLACGRRIKLMKTTDLIQILNGDIELIDHVNIKDEALLEDRVQITPRHVKKMLVAFLQGQITASDLTKWAEFICFRCEYVSVCTDIDPLDHKYQYREIADYYIDMRYVVQKLSTPYLDGEVNTISVSQYLKELDKYKDDKYATLRPVPGLWEEN